MSPEDEDLRVLVKRRDQETVRALLLGVTLSALVLWALFGWALLAFVFGKSGEDVCLGDPFGEASSGAFFVEAELWPPRYECVSRRAGEITIVSHPVRAGFGFFVFAVYPVAAGTAAIVAFEALRRKTRIRW